MALRPKLLAPLYGISFLLLFLLIASPIFAQRFANDWIKNNQNYYQFKVIKEGIYRIDHLTFTTAVVQSGIPLSKLKADKIQIFHMGQEIPIYVEGEADGVFNLNDYIEFYATKNDGTLDTKMYENGIEDQLHRSHSLYTDTAIYFVTFLPDTSSQKGKRFTNYNNTSFSTPKYQYFVEQKAVYDNTSYDYGNPYLLNATDMSYTEFTAGEGYRSPQFGASTAVQKKFEHFSTENYEASGFKPYLDLTFLGSNNVRTANPDHKVEVLMGKNLNSLQNIWDTIFEGYKVISKRFEISSANMDTALDIGMQPVLTGNFAQQNMKFSHASVTYPAKFDLNEKTSKRFVVEPEFFSPRHLSWLNYRTGYNSPLVYCLNLNLRIAAQVTPTRECRFMTPISATYDTFYMADVNDVINITKVEFTPLKRFDDHIDKFNYIIITSKQLASSANEYAAYRSNSYTPVVTFAEELYNSFSYGYHHPLAIRNYCDFLLEKSSNFPPNYLLLLGKGVEPQYYRGGALGGLDLVPVYGTPGSDNILTSGLKGSLLWEPAIATGRVTAINNQQVRDYLQKVREYESAGNAYWRKSVMHLSGGSDEVQAARILGAMNGNKTYVENLKFAGKVTTFSRSNKALIDPEVRKSTIDNINSGKSLITFIGHGSASVFDLDVGKPTDYENVGKYPVCYFNGCSTGNPFTGEGPIESLSYGLQMIRLKQRGAVAFIAQTSLAEESNVIHQVQVFYQEAFDLHYGEPIGDLLKYMIRKTQVGTSGLRKIHSRQLLLQGDPAIRLYSPDKPEYQVRKENLSLVPGIVSALADSFILRVKVENLGAFVDSIKPTIKITRVFPDRKTTREYQVTLPSIRYEHTLDFVIYSKDPSTAGLNEFTVNINPFRTISEFGNEYNNNIAKRDFNIANNGVSLVFPERFGIVAGDSVELTFQPLNLFIQNQPFVVQLDTSRRFDPNTSGVYREKNFNENSIGKWKVDLPDFGTDSVAWYWRAYLVVGGPSGGFVERSFTNIKTHPPGWCQTEFPQLAQGTPKAINLDSTSRKFNFVNLIKPIWIDMSIRPSGEGVKEAGFSSQDLNFGVGLQRDEYQDCPTNGLVVMLWDRNTLERFLLPNLKPKCYWGSVWIPHNPAAQPQNTKYQAYYVFNLGLAADQQRFIDFVNLLEEGTYTTGYSHYGITPTAWTPAVKSAFNQLGCIRTDSLNNDNTVYIFRGKKGAVKGSADEAFTVYDPNVPGSNKVDMVSELLGAGSKGTLTSEIIGPVDSWGTVYHWFETDAANPGSDNAYIDIFAQNAAGKDTLIMNNVRTSPVNISDLDPEKYRFLYLKATMEDAVKNTCPQLMEWRVTYKKVPEGTIDPGNNFVFYKDTLDEGDSFRFELNYTNISDLNFKDSLPVDYILFAKSSQTLIDSGRVWVDKALLVDSTYRFKYARSTRGLAGTYQFEMIVNRNFKQPEQILTNNAAVVNFTVLKDVINPLLDVTFDGRHIINNEIVSPNPMILIVSKDENKLLLQSDTNTFSVMMKYPNTSQFVEIPIGSSDITFIPASNTNNLAKLEYRPKNLADGTYTLRVQSKDGSDNQAGDNFYEISFRVINEQTVTNFYPYPNPFSTSMRFVFTLTGAELPQDIRISIMTLSGKVVRQITKDELGNIQLGNNISEFAWDGTDQFGDVLANGVYLYKVDVTDANGKAVKEANFDAADAENRVKYFKKNIGKLYIMR